MASHRPDRLSDAVVEAVAEEEGIEPSELEPALYDAVDPDALDSLFARSDGGDDPSGWVTFRFTEYEITAYSDGTVSVRDQSGD